MMQLQFGYSIIRSKNPKLIFKLNKRHLDVYQNAIVQGNLDWYMWLVIKFLCSDMYDPYEGYA